MNNSPLYRGSVPSPPPLPPRVKELRQQIETLNEIKENTVFLEEENDEKAQKIFFDRKAKEKAESEGL